MNENAIKNYATWARRELIAEVERRCAMYGITAEKDCPLDIDSVEGRVLTSLERKQRRELVAMARSGMDALVERAAYTWFNRVLAIRFMECNDRLPSQTRMFSSTDGSFSPQVLKEALSVEINGVDRAHVASLLQAGDDEALFRYLFLLQCDELAACMPSVFDKMEKDPLVLLLPDGLLRPEGVIGKIVADIDEADWRDGVQIVGWMYQFYISEKKDEFFASKRKATADDIPAATQLFTPEWIVQYLVQNSLGRLWMLNHPESQLTERMGYYIAPEVDACEEFQHVSSPEEITLIDPACGSGHMLVYAFDLLAAIYEERGYYRRDIPRLVLEKNLTGVEIDCRAGALASFALTMKACEYDSRFLRRGVLPKIVVLEKVEFGPEHIDAISSVRVAATKDGGPFLLEQVNLLDGLAHLDEIGSLYAPTDEDMTALRSTARVLGSSQSLFSMHAGDLIKKAVAELEPLHMLYSVVITNPPYMPVSSMQQWASSWVKKHYPEGKSDLCTCFMDRGAELLAPSCFEAMVTMQGWMFLSSYEAMRHKLLTTRAIVTMAHLGAHAFDAIGGEVVSTTASVFRNSVSSSAGSYIRLVDFKGEKEKREALKKATAGDYCDWAYKASSSDFQVIPGWPISYSASNSLIGAFKKGEPLSTIAAPKTGLVTGNNEKYLRFWWEIKHNDIGYGFLSREAAAKSKLRWFPCQKGGPYRRWYGNNYYVVDWFNDGETLRNSGLSGTSIRNTQFFFQEGITWSVTGSNAMAMRYSPAGFVFETKGSICFSNSHTDLLILLALMNTSVANRMLQTYSPTMDFGQVTVGKMPIIKPDECDDVIQLVNENVEIAKRDYDSFEVSWDFDCHPLISWSHQLWDVTSIGATMNHFYGCHPETGSPLELCYMLWQGQCRELSDRLKANEEELNRIFARIYNMENEVSSEVPDDKVSVRLADKTRDIKSFVSYAVGCMVGRYSLDADGLVLANQGDGMAEYLAKVPEPTFLPDDDGIIPITDTEYFHDDATGFFVDFVRTVYGEESLEENLSFVADALGGSGTPREVIREYFMNSFFVDHCKAYQKHPIYWLFDSGKKGGFRALVYMHRYKPDLLAKLRTDYVHEQQDRYRTQIEHIDDALESADRRQQAELKKRRKKLTEQLAEIGVFEEKVHHLADQMIEIDLDDGVSANYAKFQDVLAKMK